MRELNDGFVHDEDDKERGDWGLDDIEEFAKRRSQEEGIDIDEDGEGDGELSWIDLTPKGTKADTLTGGITVDKSYVRRNRPVLNALKSLKRRVEVAADDGRGDDVGQEVEEDEEYEEEYEEDEEEDVEDLDDEFDPSRGSGSNGGLLSELESAGFSINQVEGEIFLERSFKMPKPSGPKGSQAKVIKKVEPVASTTPLMNRAQRREDERRRKMGATLAMEEAVSTSPPSPNPLPLVAEKEIKGDCMIISTPIDPKPQSITALRWALSVLESPSQALDTIVLLHPHWSRNGCRIVLPSSSSSSSSALQPDSSYMQPIDCPTPAVAAQMLRSLASLCRRLSKESHGKGYSTSERLSLCDHPVVVGLVECLRVSPPRTTPDQERDIELQRSLSSAARSYWLGGKGQATGGIGSQQPSSESDWLTAPPAPPLALPGRSSDESAADLDDNAEQTGSSLPTDYSQIVSKYSKKGKGHSNNSKPNAPRSSQPPSQDPRSKVFASAIWSLSFLSGPTPYFVKETEALIRVAQLPSLDPSRQQGMIPWMLHESDLADILWALANARHYTTRLADLEAAVVQVGGLAAMSPSEMSRSLWAFASLNYTPGKLLAALSPLWSWKLRGRKAGPEGREGDILGFSISQLTSSLWSLAVLGQVDSVPFIQAWAQLMGTEAKPPVRAVSEVLSQGEVVLAQIWQAAIAVSLESSWSTTKVLKLDPKECVSQGLGIDLFKRYHPTALKLLTEARQSFLKQTTALRKKVHGGYQRSIANSLPSMTKGGGHLIHLLEDTSAGGYAVDISLPALKIAIEADGPTHLARNDMSKVLGGTMMKHRHLKGMGWHVVSITFAQWDLLDTAEKRKRYLEQAIASVIDEKIEQELSE